MIAKAQDQLVGRSLGEFVLRERIGEGGFGAVYRAVQPALDREAVVKVLHARLHASSAAAERFLREAKLASKLDHPYAAHVYAFGAERDGHLWIAMELVRGTPLDQVLKIQGALSLERLGPLLDRICEVVHTAHEQGIVHRDLKPANVMVLARAGRLLPKLLDFGIAKGLANEPTSEPHDGLDDTVLKRADLDDVSVKPTGATLEDSNAPPTTSPRLNLTQPGAVMGSPHYMAPEQWRDAGHVDARTDLYALGILAYECLSGLPPFNGKSIHEIARAHEKHHPAPLAPRVPHAVDKVLAKVLAKKPADRYPDALAFAAAFRDASGLAAAPVSLPAIDAALRSAAMADAPQPIAEAIAAIDAARNSHQARDAIAGFARTLARYVGLLALACRSRITGADEPVAVADTLRTLTRRTLTDAEWLDLACTLTRAWAGRGDAYPIPELVDVLGDSAIVDDLRALAALRGREIASDAALVEVLGQSVARIARVLGAFAFLDEYALVVPISDGVAEHWMGVRRTQRATTAVRGKGLPLGVPALVDSDGAPVLSLAPLFQVAAPAPGAATELFMFDGRDARGAKLVAMPAAFEHHDDALWSWFRAQLASSFDDSGTLISEAKPPYRGLSAFSSDDGESFFGREKLVDTFVNRLKLQPLLAVVGRSGAGKSSFVHAGVVPALGWRAIAMRPGPSPLAALVARLEHAGFETTDRDALARDRGALGALLRADAARRGPIVLIVDQLEELFTLCQDADERRAFAEAIGAAARAPGDPVRVIFTLRDDFLVRTHQVPALRNAIGPGLQLLGVPGADELRRILVEPARRVGYEFEDPALPAEMVKEVADQPGALALISFAAAKLWELRDRHFKQLTRASYKALGGVGGALAKHADATLDEMPPEERALARDAFRQLVTTQNTRAVLTRKDLRQLLGGGEHADRVIEKLVGARLFVASENETGAETIEIIHEALLVTWPRLVEWRREDAEGARFREQLRTAAAQWHERGRSKGLVWSSDALADYMRWRARHPGPLTDVEAAFADASVAEGARGRRNRRLLLATAFVVLATGVATLALLSQRIAGQRARAETAASELQDHLQSQYEDQGRRLVLGGDPLQALAYLDEARKLGAGGAAHDFLVAEAVRATDGELLEVHHDNFVRSPQFSHDGTRLLTAGYDNEARIWDARTGDKLLALRHPAPVLRATFSADDARVLTGGIDGTTILWDAKTGAQLRQVKHTGVAWCTELSRDGQLALTAAAELELTDLATGAARVRTKGDGTGFHACAFSPDGSRIAAGNNGGVVGIWDVHTGKLEHELHGARGDVNEISFSPDGTRLVTAANNAAIVWDLTTGNQLLALPHQSLLSSAEYSSDGKSIVTAGADRVASVWDATTGRKLLALAGHASVVYSARFTPDDQYIITVSADASAQLWDARDGRSVARWLGHRDEIFDRPAFAPDGKRFVTASNDGTAIVWNLAPQERVVWLARRGLLTTDAQFSPDGKHVVTAGADGVKLWDAASGAQQRVVFKGDALVASYSPDGRSLAAGGKDGKVRIWDATSGAPSGALGTDASPIAALAWSPDGATIVTANDDRVRGWSVRDARARFEQSTGAGVYGLSFVPGGDRFITIGEDFKVRVWDLSGKIVSTRADPDFPVSVDVDPTGAHVLSAAGRQRAKIWNLSTGATEVSLSGHVGELFDGTWSPDGAFALTASRDNTARIWDSRRGAMLAIITHAASVVVARFSPDGRRVVVVDQNGGIAIHELPHLEGPAELARVLGCLPYAWHGDQLVPRVVDRSVCR